MSTRIYVLDATQQVVTRLLEYQLRQKISEQGMTTPTSPQGVISYSKKENNGVKEIYLGALGPTKII